MNGYNLKIERRQTPHYKTSLPARFKFLDSKRPITHEVLINDIGEGGSFIDKVLKEEEVGKKIALEIDLPDTQIIIRPTAQVTRIKRSL